MSAYQLSPRALTDVVGVLSRLERRGGREKALRVEDELLAAFERIAATPGLGHYRSDLTPRGFLFYGLKPYLIVYARGIDPLPILAVLHASRDVRRLLQGRSGLGLT